jgi:hypothetical protein
MYDVSEVEASVHTHRGSNPEDDTFLNTEEATTCLVRVILRLQICQVPYY